MSLRSVPLNANIESPFALVNNPNLSDIENVSFKDVVTYLWKLRKIFVNLNIGICINGAVIAGFMVWIPEWLRRTFEVNIVDAGLIYGLALLTFGSMGPFLGGWVSSRWSVKRGEKAIKAFLVIMVLLMSVKLWFF